MGCGSATPSPKHYTSSQVVEIRGKLFMVDCGEGTQIQLRRSRVAFARINHIFISHLHGDHCFGLLGMISSFGLLGRTAPMFVHAPQELEPMLTQELAFYCRDLEFQVEFQGFDPDKTTVVYDDRSLSVTAFPLKHRVPCAGFLFREKATSDHLDRAAADFYASASDPSEHVSECIIFGITCKNSVGSVDVEPHFSQFHRRILLRIIFCYL